MNRTVLFLRESIQTTLDLSYLIFNPDNLENILSILAVSPKDVLLPATYCEILCISLICFSY